MRTMRLFATLPQDRLPPWIGQGLRFAIVGALNTAIDLGVYLALTRLLPFFASSLPSAKLISYGAGLLNSYYCHRQWTFRRIPIAGSSFLRFLLSSLGGWGINAGICWIGSDLLRLSEAFSLVGATGSALIVNFLVSKYYVFAPRSPAQACS